MKSLLDMTDEEVLAYIDELREKRAAAAIAASTPSPKTPRARKGTAPKVTAGDLFKMLLTDDDDETNAVEVVKAPHSSETGKEESPDENDQVDDNVSPPTDQESHNDDGSRGNT